MIISWLNIEQTCNRIEILSNVKELQLVLLWIMKILELCIAKLIIKCFSLLIKKQLSCLKFCRTLLLGFMFANTFGDVIWKKKNRGVTFFFL